LLFRKSAKRRREESVNGGRENDQRQDEKCKWRNRQNRRRDENSE